MNWRILSYVLVLGVFVVAPRPAVAQFAYHHVHLTVPDAEEATQWYITHMGCGSVEGRADAALCNSTKLYFWSRESEGPSVGTGVNHIGFSFDDLDAKVASLKAAGISLDEPGVRDIPNLFRIAFLTQWGARIELVGMRDSTGSIMCICRVRTPRRRCPGTRRCSGASGRK